MTTSPEMRNLAQRLLDCEAALDESAMPMDCVTLRTYEKLRINLSAMTGVAGFHSLASRALVLAKSEDISLSTAQINADGSLQGFSEYKPQVGIEKDQTNEYQFSERGIIFIARLLLLLHIFLGEVLTLRLLHNAWPGATFNDRDNGNGRKV
jgi:hypothetical protein